MVDDHRSHLPSFVLAQRLVLLEVIERGNGSFGCQAIAPFAHTRLRPTGQTGKTEPEGAVDAVMIEAGNALVHHHIGARPCPQALTEDEDLGPLLLRDSPQPLLYAPEQLSELSPS